MEQLIVTKKIFKNSVCEPKIQPCIQIQDKPTLQVTLSGFHITSKLTKFFKKYLGTPNQWYFVFDAHTLLKGHDCY